MDPHDAPALPEALRALLARTHDVEESLARRLGLGVSDVVALQHLVDHDDLGPVDLGHLLHIRSASATALVDRLQAAGHLRRTPHPTDGRRVVLALTDSARAEVLTALGPLLRGLGEVVAGFGPDEQRSIARFLRAATGVLESFADPPGDRPQGRSTQGRSIPSRSTPDRSTPGDPAQVRRSTR